MYCRYTCTESLAVSGLHSRLVSRKFSGVYHNFAVNIHLTMPPVHPCMGTKSTGYISCGPRDFGRAEKRESPSPAPAQAFLGHRASWLDKVHVTAYQQPIYMYMI